MTETEKKALALVNAGMSEPFDLNELHRHVAFKALCRAIEQNEALSAENERLLDLLRNVDKWLKYAPIGDNVCCCADPIEGHSYLSGHSPVDAAWHSAMQLQKQLSAALGETK